jgi:hypothetical protein
MIFFKLTATLRNLADLPHNREKFINCQIVEELTNALKYFTGDSDLMLNISRIFRFYFITIKFLLII